MTHSGRPNPHLSTEPMGNDLPLQTNDTGIRRPPSIHLRSRMLSGSMIMLLSSGFVGMMNLLYNFVVAHSLGAGRFSHANAVYTLLLLLTSFTLSYQILCSKFVARTESLPDKIGIYRLLHHRAWLWAVAIGLTLILGCPVFTSYLNLPHRYYILLIAVASVFYIPLGVQRGLMQGMYDFPRLATNFTLEVVIKVGAVVAFLALGWGVTGVILALVASIIAAYLHGWPRTQSVSSSQSVLPAWGEGIQASVFCVGQMIIYNLDVILVQHFFDATRAGVYAAVALVGRVVYMLCWSVVNGMFPFSAGHESEEHGRSVLGTALVLVVLIASLFTLGAWAAPTRLWQLLLGSGFPLNVGGSYRSLLTLYAASSGIWLLSVVIMSYEISRKIARVSWLQLAFSGAVALGIELVHTSLQDVILVRLALMIALLLIVSLPFLRAQFMGARSSVPANALRKIRRLTEDEVIAEFLRGEFHHPEYTAYRERFSAIVMHPDLTDAQQNELRRALLYHRRGRLWRELPPDTEWWEVTLTSCDLERIRMFPRNPWRKYSCRTYDFLDTAEQIRSRILARSSDAFLAKLRSLQAELATTDTQEKGCAVLLISVDERNPITIIEGNHRMTGAALVSPLDVHLRFRFFCGFSPHMMNCCWYETDVLTLLRYAKNTLTWLFENQPVALEKAVQNLAPSDALWVSPGRKSGF
jgi:hypothetical protein